MAAGTPARLKRRRPAPAYAELHCHSDHSLLDGVPSPESLVERAAELGLSAVALTDHDALYGAVRFAWAAQEAGVKGILGAELTLAGDDEFGDGAHLTLLVESTAGYANLCRLITLARAGREKGTARLDKRHLADHHEGLIALSGCRRGEIPRLLAAGAFERALEAARGYGRLFGPDRFFVELQRHYRRGDNHLIANLMVLAVRAGLDVVATGNAHYLHPHQREVHDVLTCTRCHTTLEDAGLLLRPNDEYALRSPGEMAALFRGGLIALENTLCIAERCAPAWEVLPHGPQALPAYPVAGACPVVRQAHQPRGRRERSARYYLRQLCEGELHRRYPHAPPRDLLMHELAVIEGMGLSSNSRFDV